MMTVNSSRSSSITPRFSSSLLQIFAQFPTRTHPFRLTWIQILPWQAMKLLDVNPLFYLLYSADDRCRALLKRLRWPFGVLNACDARAATYSGLKLRESTNVPSATISSL